MADRDSTTAVVSFVVDDTSNLVSCNPCILFKTLVSFFSLILIKGQFRVFHKSEEFALSSKEEAY